MIQATLDDLLAVQGVCGVIRFTPAPSFDWPQFNTFVYMDNAIVASVMVRGFGLWQVMPLQNGSKVADEVLAQIIPWLSFDIYDFQHLAPSMLGLTGSCPEEISRWEKVRALALGAPNCWASVRDGTIYGHFLYDHRTAIRVSWGNPDLRNYPVQAGLINAYAKLLARANLTPKQAEDAFGLNKVNICGNTPIECVIPDCAEDTEEELQGKSGKKRRKRWQRRKD
jgi:hypothetical protein